MISKTLNKGKNLEEMLQAVLEALLDITNIETGWIFLIDKEQQHRLIASHGLPEGLQYNDCEPLKIGGCWCMNKFRNGELKHAVNILNCKRLEMVKTNHWGCINGMERHATIPIKAGEEPLGLMNIASVEIDSFSQDDLDLLETVAYQMGATIKRFQLYLEEQERARMLSQLQKYIAQISQEANIDTFLEHAGELALKYFDWKGIQFKWNHTDLLVGEKAVYHYSSRIEWKPNVLEISIFGDHISKASSIILEEILTHLSLQLQKLYLHQEEKKLVKTNERERISRDLHDSVNQLLFSLILHAKGLEKRLTDQDHIYSVQLIKELGDEALKEVKQLIFQLRPEGLELGIVTAINRYSDLVDLDIEVNAKGLKKISSERELPIWRILQEAINNCKKHAQTNDMKIQITFIDTMLKIVIEDHGIGFNPNQIQRGIGLNSIQKRVEELGGEYSLFSEVHKGTKICLLIPLK
ncbi:hypothetical protein BTS2_1085 [Bacillus sp. TS-2]|nr:hypothetical protein BTS2_1085 [Bacillus sp. TS-2]